MAFCQIVTARRHGVGIFNNRVSESPEVKNGEPFFFHKRRAQISARGTSHFVLVASSAENFALFNARHGCRVAS